MLTFHSGGALRAQSQCLSRLSHSGLLLITAGMAITATHAQQTLYFTDIFRPSFADGSVGRVNSDNTGLQTLANVGGGLRAVAVDAAAGKIYWTDVENDVIRRANLDGGSAEDVVTSGLSFPMSIAINPLEGKFYCLDQSLHQIFSAKLDGSEFQLVADVYAPTDVKVDAANGKLYWTEAVPNTYGAEGVILRANLDGSQVETAVAGAGRPARIALDLAGGKIYWTDYVNDVVGRANLDGTQAEDLYVVGENLNPGGITLDLRHGKVYWGQETSSTPHLSKIMRMDLDGSNPEDATDIDFGTLSTLEIPAPLLGDLDGDGDVDLDDEVLIDCLTGPDVPIDHACEPADLQADQDVDIADYRVFQAAFTAAP